MKLSNPPSKNQKLEKSLNVRRATKALALLLAFALLLPFTPATVAKADPAIPAKIIFTLDDGWRDNYEYAKDVFQAYGFPATVYVNSDMVDKNNPNFMTLAQLKTLYDDYGWDLANHTASHRELGLYNDEARLIELEADYKRCRDWLINNGFPRGATHAAYPSGRYTKELVSVLQGIGMKTGRNTVSGLQSTPITGQDTYFNLPMKAVSSNYSLDSCKNAINAAVANGSTVIFMLHRVLPEMPDPPTLTTTVADLHILLDFTKNLVDQGKAEVLTISQWYDEQIVNPLTPEAPPAPAVTADDIANTVSGLTVIMEYSLDGAPYEAYRSATFNALDLTGPHTLNVRYAASGINPAGPDTALTFTTNHTVRFDSRGGSPIDPIAVNDNATISAPVPPTLTGHTLAGWYRDEGLTDDWDFNSDTVTDNITLYAKWTANSYTVRFDKNGGDTEASPGAITADYNTTISLPAPPEKTGHTFTGWNTMPEGNGNAFTDVTAVTGDATVYAQWSVNRYTIAFDKNGGDTEASPGSIEADYNTFASLPTPPEKAGHTFTGWNTMPDGTGSPFTGSTAVTGDATVYAQWAINSYTVTFQDWNGDTLKTESVLYLSAATAPADPIRTGFTFTGWDVAFGSVSHDLVVTAQYIINTYTVTFDKNGGTTEPSPKTKTAQYNTTVVLPTPPGKTGSAFVGWSTMPDGTGTSFTDDTIVTEDITVYAQWLTTPAIKTPLATYNSLRLTWAAAKYAAGYEVWRAASSTGTYTRIATVTATTYTNTGLATNQPYYYKLKAYWLNGSTKVYAGFSGTVSARPVPSAPASCVADPASYNSARIKWSAVSGASGYEVYRALNYTTGTYTRIATTTSTSYSNTGLATGSTYYYKVRAYRTVNRVKVYGPFSTADGARPILAVPGSVRAARASISSIKITWARVSGASGYELWRATSSTGTYALVKTTASLYYTNSGLTTGRTYYYKVRAYRVVSGRKVYGSFTAQASANTSMAAPASVRASRVSSTSVKITWRSSAGTTRYELWRSATGASGTYGLVATTPSLYYTNGGLVAGRTYWYKVRCYRLVGTIKVYSPFSATLSYKAQ